MSSVSRARSMVRSVIRRTARDVTDQVGARHALVIAPHPLDETLGCGLTIRRKVAAHSRVTILVVTDGRHSHASRAMSPDELAALRRAEMAEAARRLGVAAECLHFAGLEDGTAAVYEDGLVKTITELISEVAPDEVYATCVEEPHPDHAATGRAARRAVAAVGTPVALLEYPVGLWQAWPLRRHDVLRSAGDAAGRAVRRRAVVVRAGDNLTAKWHALQAHSSQLYRPRGVPAEEPWPGLPRPVLSAAADRYELFFPVQPD